MKFFRLEKLSGRHPEGRYYQSLSVIPRNVSGCPGKRSGIPENFFFYLPSQFDVYVKKQLIESLIDDLHPDTKEKINEIK